LQQLRGWGVDAKFAFVGGAPAALAAHLGALADDLGLRRNVILFEDTVDEATYRLFLSASDIGIQLRGYGMGGLSGSLLDCIAASLPAVAERAPCRCDGCALLRASHAGRDQPRPSCRSLSRPVVQRVVARPSPGGQAAYVKTHSLRLVFPYSHVGGGTRSVMHVDITELASNPLRTGIQRVVRELLKNWRGREPLSPCVYDRTHDALVQLPPTVLSVLCDENADDLRTASPAQLADEIQRLRSHAPVKRVDPQAGGLLAPELFYDAARCQFYRRKLAANPAFAHFLIY